MKNTSYRAFLVLSLWASATPAFASNREDHSKEFSLKAKTGSSLTFEENIEAAKKNLALLEEQSLKIGKYLADEMSDGSTDSKQKKALMEENDSLKKQVETLTGLLKKSNEELKKDKNWLTDQMKTLEMRDKQQKNLTQEIDSLKQEIGTRDKQQKNLTQEIDSLKQEIGWKQEIENEKKKYEKKYESEKAFLILQMDDQKKKYESDKAFLILQILQMDDQKKKYESEKAFLQNQINNQEIELRNLKNNKK